MQTVLMTMELPAELQVIKDRCDQITGAISENAVYGLEFTFAGNRSLTTLQSSTPLHIPSRGDLIRLHDVAVSVESVTVSYSADESGDPLIVAMVDVKPDAIRGR